MVQWKSSKGSAANLSGSESGVTAEFAQETAAGDCWVAAEGGSAEDFTVFGVMFAERVKLVFVAHSVMCGVVGMQFESFFKQIGMTKKPEGPTELIVCSLSARASTAVVFPTPEELIMRNSGA